MKTIKTFAKLSMRINFYVIIFVLLLTSCQPNLNGEIIEQKIDKNDFIVMDLFDLRKKYSKEIRLKYEFYMAIGCIPYLKFEDMKQVSLINTSKEDELKFTVLVKQKKYPLIINDEKCFEPNFEIHTFTSDTDFVTLEPGDRKKLVAKEYYDDGHFISVNYEITGAKKIE